MKVQKHRIAHALRAAASALEGRGPQSPQAIFRYGSKPNQAEIMRYMREFLDVYAQAGNDLMEGRHPGENIERLQNLGTRIRMDLDDLITAVREQTGLGQRIRVATSNKSKDFDITKLSKTERAHLRAWSRSGADTYALPAAMAKSLGKRGIVEPTGHLFDVQEWQKTVQEKPVVRFVSLKIRDEVFNALRAYDATLS